MPIYIGHYWILLGHTGPKSSSHHSLHSPRGTHDDLQDPGLGFAIPTIGLATKTSRFPMKTAIV